jgi:NitT/TauT family transport system permease protein
MTAFAPATPAAPAAPATSIAAAPTRRRLSRAIGLLLILGALLLIWEGVKFLGGDPWRINGFIFGIPINFFHDPPLSFRIANDQSLPHIWEVLGTMTRPVQPNRPPLAALLFDNAVYTFRGAAFGFFLGATFGLLLGILLAHVRLLERALVPYVVMSQTIPIIAIAPVIVIGLHAGEFSVALVASYLRSFRSRSRHCADCDRPIRAPTS